MAIFGLKPKTKEKDYAKAAAPAASSKARRAAPVKEDRRAPVKAKAATAAPVGSFSIAAEAILRPRITEKSGILSQSGVYTFEITRGADKASVARAVKALYKVTAVKVAIINLPTRNIIVKGRKGTVSGVRKALVTVKKGDKIDFV